MSPTNANYGHDDTCVPSGALEVTWADAEGDLLSRLYGITAKWGVMLHAESTCSSRREDLLVPGGLPRAPKHYLANAVDIALPTAQDNLSEDARTSLSDHPADAAYGCPCDFKLQTDHKAIFEDLNPEEAYFPMVSRIESQSFFSLPPASIRPSTLAAVLCVSAAETSRLPTRSRSATSAEPKKKKMMMMVAGRKISTVQMIL